MNTALSRVGLFIETLNAFKLLKGAFCAGHQLLICFHKAAPYIYNQWFKITSPRTNLLNRPQQDSILVSPADGGWFFEGSVTLICCNKFSAKKRNLIASFSFFFFLEQKKSFDSRFLGTSKNGSSASLELLVFQPPAGFGFSPWIGQSESGLWHEIQQSLRVPNSALSARLQQCQYL